jgi:TolB-like protein
VAAVPLNCRSESEEKAVRKQLDRILGSGPFQQSRRRQRFLEYIVDETLAGRGERLKGYSIAQEVFERPQSFDPNVDPLVRIEAGRLRDRLREYYEGEGHDDPIRIDLPKGTYIPTIEFRLAASPEARAAPPPEPPAGAAEDRQSDPAPPVAAGDKLGSPSISLAKLVRWQIAVPALAAILALGAVGAWHFSQPRMPTPPNGATEGAAVEAPSGPAIAVLPFVNLSGDPKQDYFSDGLTEDILTELSRARGLRVLARNTTFQYKGKAVDVSKLGRDLGVRYVLEGSIQRTSDRIRVSAQLIDAETGSHVWADRFDREMADLFVLKDEITSQIFAKIAGSYGVIERTEANSAARKSPEQIQAYDLVLRAHEIMQWDWSRANFRSARETLLRAVALDPANAHASRELAYLALIGWVFVLDDPPVPPQEIITRSAKAVELDPDDARARMVLACAYFFNKQPDLFEHEVQQALALAPYDAEMLATFGKLYAVSGQWQRGVALAQKAYALNPDASVGWYHSAVSMNYYMSGDYERALEVLRQDTDKNSLYLFIELIPVYGQLGRKDDALENWHKILAEQPGWTATHFENWWRTWNMRDEDMAKLMDGIYKSGVLGGAAKAGQ